MSKVIYLDGGVVLASEVAGFGYSDDGGYNIFMKGGGYVKSRSSHWLYEELSHAVHENAVREQLDQETSLQETET